MEEPVLGDRPGDYPISFNIYFNERLIGGGILASPEIAEEMKEVMEEYDEGYKMVIIYN